MWLSKWLHLCPQVPLCPHHCLVEGCQREAGPGSCLGARWQELLGKEWWPVQKAQPPLHIAQKPHN